MLSVVVLVPCRPIGRHLLNSIVWLLGLTTGLSAVALPAAELPNVVVFISDDLGRNETSVYGSPDVRTPNLDRLASLGMTFDNAYVASPSCCPNRYSLLTGLMPARHGAHPNHSQVKPGTAFLPPILKQMGYHVASFGKIAHGSTRFPGCDFHSAPARGMSERVREYFKTQDFQQPICLLVGDRRPHVPWIDKASYAPKELQLPDTFIDTLETRQHWARYLTDISGMDTELGEILDFAQQHLGDNTIFLFTSDHGGQWPRGKWNLYDAGARVPLIVAWPERIAANRRTPALVSWVDILPTLIDLADGQVAADLDGKSFAAVLRGEAKEHRERVFTTHTGDGVMNIYPMRGVREGSFKYIHNLCPEAVHTNHSDRLRKDGAGAYWDSWDQAAATDPKAAEIVEAYYVRPEFELYDLAHDPLELNNLATLPEQADRLARMQQLVQDWMQAQGDDGRPHRPPYPASEPLPELRSGSENR